MFICHIITMIVIYTDYSFFFFNDTATTEIYTLSLHDALPISIQGSNVPNPDEAVPSFVSGAMAKAGKGLLEGTLQAGTSATYLDRKSGSAGMPRPISYAVFCLKKKKKKGRNIS